MRICVFCSSAKVSLEVFGEVAVEVGRVLVGRGHELVYGGTAVGMMAALAGSVRAAGGRVTGVVPRLLVERGLADERCDELVVTDGMADRKTTMGQQADGFLALPGGLGTLDELLEIVTLKQLGYHRDPVALYNAAGFYDPLVALLAALHAQGLSLPPEELVLVTAELDAAFDHLEAGPQGPRDLWRA